jgi:hypothetical protein
VTDIVVGLALGHARQQRQDRGGPVQRLDAGFLIHAQHHRRLGGLRYNPTTSRTFSMNWGSVDSLKVSTRCGLSPKARQIRLIADCDIPVARAKDRVDQWVASFGVVSRVMTSTCSICSSVIVRAAPGRGSSARPSSRRATNRDRHLVTVGRDTPAV